MREQLAGFLSYIETMFNVFRRMADARFAAATSWTQALQIHGKWVQDYNLQQH